MQIRLDGESKFDSRRRLKAIQVTVAAIRVSDYEAKRLRMTISETCSRLPVVRKMPAFCTTKALLREGDQPREIYLVAAWYDRRLYRELIPWKTVPAETAWQECQ